MRSICCSLFAFFTIASLFIGENLFALHTIEIDGVKITFDKDKIQFKSSERSYTLGKGYGRMFYLGKHSCPFKGSIVFNDKDYSYDDLMALLEEHQKKDKGKEIVELRQRVLVWNGMIITFDQENLEVKGINGKCFSCYPFGVSTKGSKGKFVKGLTLNDEEVTFDSLLEIYNEKN